MSDHREPLFGDAETLSAVAILPVAELMAVPSTAAMLIAYLQTAEPRDRVDVAIVREYQPDHDHYLDETFEALEIKWRPRVQVGIADHRTWELVPAGYLEVRP